MLIIENKVVDLSSANPESMTAVAVTRGKNKLDDSKRASSRSISLFEYEDSWRKPLYGILQKAPFFNSKNYEKGKGYVRKWTLKMFKFDMESGVLSYCDASSYQKSNQIGNFDTPTVMLGKCQYFHVSAGACCESIPESDNPDKCEFVFKIEGLTGVHDKSLFLSAYTPDERAKWINRISNYTQNLKLDAMKLREYDRMKLLLNTQDAQIEDLTKRLEDLVQLSAYLKSQTKKYQGVAEKMARDNDMLLDKLELVSKEISGLRHSLKENTISDQIQQLALKPTSPTDNSCSDQEFTSPEVEYLENFSRYLDIKRNDIIRLSTRRSKSSTPTTGTKLAMNISGNSTQNDLSSIRDPREVNSDI